MRIIIAGAGDMGFHLAKLLSSEAQDIVLIDSRQDVLDHAAAHLDVVTLKGDSSSIKLLKEAGVGKADLLIAATYSEKNNIITAILGKKLGAAKTIARIQTQEYLAPKEQHRFRELGIDSLISPRQLAATEICRLITDAALTDIYEFEDGKLCLLGLTLNHDTEILGMSVLEVANKYPEIRFRPIAIRREQETLIPRVDTFFDLHDHVYFISKKKDIDKILDLSGSTRIKVKNIMILGGSATGVQVAQLLEQKYKVKVIERKKERCYELVEKLKNTLVLHGDGSDVEVLQEEDLQDMDVFIALTGNAETNIITSLVAKDRKVGKTIAMVDNLDYINLSQSIGVDTLINRKLIAANMIFRYIRQGNVKEIASMRGVEGEIIEYIVGPGARISKGPIKEIGFPEGALIGGVIRGKDSYIPLGDFEVRENDNVLVFAMPDAITKVEKFFK